MALPTSCAACTMFKPGDLCVAHSPSPTTVAHEVAKWPRREPSSVCAEGSTDKQPITCENCLYWWTPDGLPLPEKTSTRAGFWAVSGGDRKEAMKMCVHHTASPGAETVMYYPRVTYATHACGSGKTPEQVIAEAAGKG